MDPDWMPSRAELRKAVRVILEDLEILVLCHLTWATLCAHMMTSMFAQIVARTIAEGHQ